MAAYALRRLAVALPTIFGVTLITFLMIHLVPGNPAVMIAGEGASPRDIHNIAVQLGLNRPILSQYGLYIAHLFQGNLGFSFSTQRPVVQEIQITFPVTFTLAVLSTGLAVTVGLATGLIAAARSGTLPDSAAMVVTLVGLSFPSFWLGLMLILVFGVDLHWLPVAGWTGFASMVLPSITLGAPGIAVVARMTRASLLQAMSGDYIRTARAKGASENRVFLGHALRNALLPVLTVIGLEFGTLLGGAVITEDVFAIPGMGRLVVQAITARDYPTVEGGALVIALVFVAVNLVTDLSYILVDPRIRYS